MLDRPQWNGSRHVGVLDPTNIYVIDERDYSLATGRIFPRLLPLLDGRRTVSEIAAQLGADIPLMELYYALSVLEGRGCLIEGDAETPPGLAAFWHSQQVRGEAAMGRIEAASVAIEAFGRVDTDALGTALASAGVRCAGDGELLIAVADDYLQPGLGAVNRAAVHSGRPWLLIKPVGTIIWIGPLFRPGITGCWACLAQRLRSNRQMETFLENNALLNEPLPISTAAFPVSVAIAMNLAALEVARALVTGAGTPLEGQVLTIDTLSLESERHRLVRRPQCPVCGDSEYARREARPVALAPALKRYRFDGGHRTTTPEATYERHKHQISRITGVVSSLTDLTEDRGNGIAYSYSAGHNFALLGNDLNYLMQNLRGRSGGKGSTDIQARVSAICEAVERYSGVYRQDEIEIQASLDDLGDAAIHPNRMMCFSERQYEDRLSWNARHSSAFHRVPERFDERRRVHWTPAWSLTNERSLYVPSAYCYYGHPNLRASYFCSCDANGNAAGNTLEEAIFQGFMELVERDSVALWWYNRVPRVAVDLDSFGEPYFERLREYYHSLHRDLWVLDLTSDLGIPAFAAVSRRNDRAAEDIVLGFGAHLDAKIAVLRALTEANQFLPAVSRQDDKGNTIYWFPEREAVEWWTTATVANQPYLLPDAATTIAAGAYSRAGSDDLRQDLEYCVDLACRHGLETLVLDQTQPDVGLPVVKVMVPGLRHFWKRFGPGRLYDVPVRQGWLAGPTAEQDLNPIGIFF